MTAFEWIARRGLDLVFTHIPNTRDPLSDSHAEYLLIELTSGHDDGSLREALEGVLADAMERGEVLDATIAESRAQAADFWRLREALPEAQLIEAVSIKHDISVPVYSVPEFLRTADAALATAMTGIRVCAFGHIGDGNIHYNLAQPKGADGAEFTARTGEINRIVHDIVIALGGSISAEHGIGRLKRGALAHYAQPLALEMMRSLKATFDPNNIMNPGKII